MLGAMGGKVAANFGHNCLRQFGVFRLRSYTDAVASPLAMAIGYTKRNQLPIQNYAAVHVAIHGSGSPAPGRIAPAGRTTRLDGRTGFRDRVGAPISPRQRPGVAP